MEPTILLACFLPILLILLSDRRQQSLRLRWKKRKKKGGSPVTNELIRSLIGETCSISLSGGLGSVVGVLSHTEENWLEVECKKGQKKLLNIDYIMEISPLPKK